MSVPWPEGSPQNPPTAQQMLAYLDQLTSWIDAQRAELDRLDQKLQAAANPLGTQDIAMTLTVWQAIKDRSTDLLRRWNSGRVTAVDLSALAAMTWANLNDMLTPGTSLSTGGGLALSLPEACRMLEALIAQLSARYQLAPVTSEAATRISALRAQVARIEDQAKLDPPPIRQASAAAVEQLSNGLRDLIARADRGADIGGYLGPLEVRAAQLERDLIVGHAERARLAERVNQAAVRRAALITREQQILELVRTTAASVTPAPKYAVPHIEALGPVPVTAQELDSYLGRLEQVGLGFDIVQRANQQALAARSDLITRWQAAQAATTNPDALSDSLASQIEALLATQPTPLAVLAPLLAAYEAHGRPQ